MATSKQEAQGLGPHHHIIKQRYRFPAVDQSGRMAGFSSVSMPNSRPSPLPLPSQNAQTGSVPLPARPAAHGVGCSSATSWEIPLVCDKTRIEATMS
jgi:hypothetical protein